MAEPNKYQEITDHVDAQINMMLRRVVNEDYAEGPVDFNVEGLSGGQKLAERPLTSDDIIVDIGSSSGEIIAAAALKCGVKATIFCVEKDLDALDSYKRLPPEIANRVTFMNANGERLPFKTSSVFGASLHNVIYRAKDGQNMLNEVQRVVEPGGFIAISSNAQGHAYFRHKFETLVARVVMERSGVEFKAPTPPAQKYYLEDLPSLFERVGNLDTRADLFVPQDTKCIITLGRRLDDYVDAIKYSAVNFDVPNHLWSLWRSTVDEVVRSEIETGLATRPSNQTPAGVSEPYFVDSIKRGMFVLQNNKPAT